MLTGFREKMGWDEPGSGLKAWKADQMIKLDAAKNANFNTAVQDAAGGAAMGIAQTVAKHALNKIFGPKEGEEGANTSKGALSGGQAWEQFYTGDEFTSLPAWYM